MTTCPLSTFVLSSVLTSKNFCSALAIGGGRSLFPILPRGGALLETEVRHAGISFFSEGLQESCFERFISAPVRVSLKADPLHSLERACSSLLFLLQVD